MSWRDYLDDIETCEFEDVAYLSDIAADDDTTPDGYMPPKERPNDVWFHIEGAGCACLWFPRNRSGTMRFSHCYVRPEERGDGKGKALTVYRYQYAKKHPDCTRVDALAAHSPGLYSDFGMELVEKRGENDHIFYMAMDLDKE